MAASAAVAEASGSEVASVAAGSLLATYDFVSHSGSAIFIVDSRTERDPLAAASKLVLPIVGSSTTVGLNASRRVASGFFIEVYGTTRLNGPA